VGDVAGTIKKVVLDGLSYDALGDTNISEVHSKFENEGVPTSGRTIQKKIRRVPLRENVVVAANGAEADRLTELSERTGNYPMSYETASGDVYRTTGFIEFENRETEENRATLKLIPSDTDGWTPFLA